MTAKTASAWTDNTAPRTRKPVRFVPVESCGKYSWIVAATPEQLDTLYGGVCTARFPARRSAAAH